MDRTRRAVLAGTGTALLAGLAGCGGDGGEGGTDTDSPTPNATTEDEQTPTATPTAQTVVDQELTLREGGYESWQFYVDSRFTLEYDIEVLEDGPPVDVYVVVNRQLNPFEAERAFDRVASSEGVQSDSVSATIESGTYHVIVDHSNRGATEPPGGLTQDPVDVSIAASYEPNA